MLAWTVAIQVVVMVESVVVKRGGGGESEGVGSVSWKVVVGWQRRCGVVLRCQSIAGK